MTIARWIGHQDGGILIGKVYGHLSNEHAQRQAKKIDFGGTKLEQNQAPAQAKEKTTIEPAEVAQENQSPPE
jgi:hypothetical protein